MTGTGGGSRDQRQLYAEGKRSFYDKGAGRRRLWPRGRIWCWNFRISMPAMRGAEFAYEAMAVLEGTGVVTDLVFGSECGDISLLKEAAEISTAGRSEECGVSDTGREIGRGDGGAGQGTGREAGGGILEKEEGTETENRGEGKDQEGRKLLLSREIQKRIRAGLSYPAAFGQAVSEVWGSAAGNVFQNPNDVLGIGYLSALKNLGSKIEPHCIARTGAGHRERRTGDADIQTKFAGSGSIASGTALRKLIREKGIGAAADYLPEEVLRIFKAHLLSLGMRISIPFEIPAADRGRKPAQRDLLGHRGNREPDESGGSCIRFLSGIYESG